MTGTTTAAEPGGAPASAPNGAGPSYVVDDVRSAGDAIAGLLFGDDNEPAAPEPPARERPQQPQKSGDEEPPDTGAAETPPTEEEDDEGRDEQPPRPAAIEPPRSWNADEQAEFAKLPPALQQTIARRESQREALVTQRSQEAAEARRAFEGERQAVMAQRGEYLSGLQKMMVLAAPEAAALSNVDWVAVQAHSPAEYTRLQAMREALRGRLSAIEGEFQQHSQAIAYEQQQALGALVAREHTALNTAVPDFGDQVKGTQLRKDLSTYLQDKGGFTPQEIGQAYDHRLVLLAHKAMLYDRQIQNAAAADAKRNNPAPQVQRPGVSQDSSDRSGDSRLRTRANRLGRTHDVRDAGSLIAELL
jgi:hypothetical protein